MKFVIGSLIGAIIGYITNWLAIKMLFRPRKEIRIFNHKVPFTPGLIPKEKSRIAKNVGESVGQHILTKETIMKSLCSENMNQQLDSWVKGKVGAMKNSESTVGKEIKVLLGDEYNNFIGNTTNNNISKLLLGYMNEEDVKQDISKYVYSQIMLELNVKPQTICESELYNSIKDKVLNAAIKYKDSEDFYNEIQKVLKENIAKLVILDKKFDEVIPKGITNNVKVYVYGKRYNISMGIKKLLKEEKNSQKLRQIVDETISNKLSPMIAMFMNADSIFEKVVVGIDEYLDDEKNHNDIALAVNEIIDKLLENSINNVISDLPKEGIDDSIQPLINLFTAEIVDEKLIRDTFNSIESNLCNYISVEELLGKTGVDYKNIIEKLIKNRINTMLGSNSVEVKITELVPVVINKLLDIEMKSIFNGDMDKISKSTSKVVRDIYNKFIENKAADVIEVLDVSKIVEDKINEFDVAFGEEIILQIASKELTAITWLGALLGAIMGLLSPILGSL
ncbi:DUF445 domain-containing protein [Clostridium algoriphilum]|uniref:DUF445 family protein n=1 Tax=Clostridium algoriphilum TaxID=198347 RepID=UPI001CF1059F|nr:DUF445 family protein [Clostridium algoriphilum]MCB2293097.1 DUF445 domain-containing protein [Clostridium algoriphilum]